MSEHLPEYIDPLRLARQERSVSGSYSLSAMHRLQAYLTDDQGSVEVSLQFGMDDNRLMVIRGELHAELGLLCQRCMEPMRLQVNVPMQLAIVDSEERADALPDDYEPLVVTGDSSSLLEIVEDELILSLPIVAMHEQDQCTATGLLSSSDDDIEVVEKENPFAVLSELKKH